MTHKNKSDSFIPNENILGNLEETTSDIEEDKKNEGFFDEIVHLPIDGTLDLHTFSPKEVKELIPDYLAECRGAQIFEVRIVHGKGKGVLRRIVQSALEKIDFVDSFQLAGHGRGSWGATLVTLKKNSNPK